MIALTEKGGNEEERRLKIRNDLKSPALRTPTVPTQYLKNPATHM
jgi:hypothetical protein